MPTEVANAAPAGDSSTAIQEKVTPLKDAFKDKFLIGTVLNYPALQGKDPANVTLAQTHFSAITPENSLKPQFTQPTEGKFTLDEGDKLVEIAHKSHATVVGHCLIWHSQTPSWFFTSPDGQPVSHDLALERMRTHIATVVGHFKGRIKQWDVVNEALSDSPNEDLRPSPGSRRSVPITLRRRSAPRTKRTRMLCSSTTITISNSATSAPRH